MQRRRGSDWARFGRHHRAPVWTPCRLRAARTGQIELAAAVTRGGPTQAMEVSQIQSMTRAAHPRRHLSRHERQRQARAGAFSRRTKRTPIVPSPVMLATEELELIDRLVRHDRTAVSTALLAIAGIGAGEASRRAVLARIAEGACWA
jgi:hypothetical protein